MANVEFTDNTAQVKTAFEQAKARALEIIGGKMEDYAAALVAPRGPKGNTMRTDVTAQLRQSITHRVEGDTVVVGSNLDMAAYVELGTGREYQPSADFIESNVQKGKNSGLAWWLFYDEEQGKVRVGLPMAPTPFLRPAYENHKSEYKNIVESELKKG